jgi:hypothetical protein
MDGFSFVTLVTGLSTPNTGKEEDDGDDDDYDKPVLSWVKLPSAKLHRTLGLELNYYGCKSCIIKKIVLH